MPPAVSASHLGSGSSPRSSSASPVPVLKCMKRQQLVTPVPGPLHSRDTHGWAPSSRILASGQPSPAPAKCGHYASESTKGRFCSFSLWLPFKQINLCNLFFFLQDTNTRGTCHWRSLWPTEALSSLWGAAKSTQYCPKSPTHLAPSPRLHPTTQCQLHTLTTWDGGSYKANSALQSSQVAPPTLRRFRKQFDSLF